MNRDEARQILRVHRPHQSESSDPELAQALQMARDDAELAQWLKEENRLDEAIAEQLAAVPAPADLRQKILTRSPLDGPEREQSRWPRILFRLAAALTILASLGAFWLYEHPSGPALSDWQSGSLAVLSAVVGGADKLDHESPDSGTLRAWLRAAHSPDPKELPASFQHLSSLGCKTVLLDHKRISIICFHASATQLAHLVTVDEHSLALAPPEHQPQFVRQGEWITASWSDRGQSFMVAMKGSEPELRNLLSPTG